MGMRKCSKCWESLLKAEKVCEMLRYAKCWESMIKYEKVF